VLGIRREDQEQRSGDTWIGPAPWIETPIPGPNAKALINRDHTYSPPSNRRDYPLVVGRAAGSVVEDVDGNRFLDFAAGPAVCSTGHCHPKVTAAIEAQARSLIQMCGTEFYYPPMIELMQRLASIVPGERPQRVLLTNSGAEAVEATIKLVRYHSKRKSIIGFYGALHGRTMGYLSLSGSNAEHSENFGPLIPMVTHVPYGDIDALEDQLFKYKPAPTEIAAIFVEALQGEGGYVVPDADFLPRLRSLCDEHHILLVCDEIHSGTGRTGKWFAFEHFNIVPDIILLAKGLASGMPLGAVIARDDIMHWPPNSQGCALGGNPVCCAAALATLELVGSTYMSNAARLGMRLLGRLGEIAQQRKVISDVRGLGLMCGVDVVNRRSGKSDPRLRHRILQASFQRGLILLPCGEAAIRFCPPLCINETQLDVGLKTFDEVLATLA